jgi:hypothetical protein
MYLKNQLFIIRMGACNCKDKTINQGDMITKFEPKQTDSNAETRDNFFQAAKSGYHKKDLEYAPEDPEKDKMLEVITETGKESIHQKESKFI